MQGRIGPVARDEARRGTLIVVAISLVALVVSTSVAVGLSRVIVNPVRDLMRGVEAVRQGDFDRRVPLASLEELRLLGEGFNRMAETLGEYRASSLGELLQAKSTLESTIASIPSAVIVVDPDGRIESANPPGWKVLDGLNGAATKAIADVDFPAPIRDALEQTRRGLSVPGPGADLDQAVAIPIDGQLRKMLVTVAPIPEFQDRQPALVIVFDDVTELARLDELRSELVAVASHELKTPLTTLRMNLLMLQEQNGQFPPPQQEMLQAAITGTDDLAATIEEMLDLTRIESGQLQLRQERVDLGALLDEAVRSLQPRFDDAGIALSTHRERREHLAWGDAARLKLVFTNLLGNALKYTPRGGRVTVALARVEPADDNTVPELELTVTDEGPGVPPEFRERIFEKFFRVEHHVQEREHPPADAFAASSGSPSTSARPVRLSRMERTTHGGVRGTGIGLFLCRQIIEAHHGRIWCEPSPSGNGSRFTFRMPTGSAVPA